MKTDIIKVTSAGDGMEEALNQAESAAAYKNLPKKDGIRLRLLAEEMLGMFRSIAGDAEASFWIEDENCAFQLHLRADTRMTSERRKQFLSVSSSGENAAAKGVMGKLGDLFARALEPYDDSDPEYYMQGWYVLGLSGAEISGLNALEAEMWSLNQYKASLQEKGKSEEAWDELEKSVVASLADDVEIGIRGGKVEMVIYKTFA